MDEEPSVPLVHGECTRVRVMDWDSSTLPVSVRSAVRKLIRWGRTSRPDQMRDIVLKPAMKIWPISQNR